MVKETEFYELLQVAHEADETEIRRSYRRLALKYHPDKNPGDEAASEMFKKISHAYETLSDADKRKIYDQYGKDGLNGDTGGGGFHDASDIFSMFFGGGRRERGEPKPRELVHELQVSLEEMYVGKLRKVMVSRNRLCAACEGRGLKAGAQKESCRACRGHGVQVRVQQLFPGFHQQVQVRCPACGGEGETTRPGDVCGGCRGQCILREKKTLEVNIERGARRNDVLHFAGEGDQVPGVRLPGDIMIILAQKPHSVFRRVGNHLLMNYTLTLQEALCGFELPIAQLDGRLLLVKVPAGHVITPDAAWCVHGEGMPLPGTGGFSKGNLYIHFSIEWPGTLPAAQIDRVATAFEVPDKLPRVGGHKVELVPCRNAKSARTAQRRQVEKASRVGLGRGAKSHTRRGRDDEEYESVSEEETDFGDREEAQWRGRGGAGPQGQTMQCAQQ